jgi:hypothetical protein
MTLAVPIRSLLLLQDVRIALTHRIDILPSFLLFFFFPLFWFRQSHRIAIVMVILIPLEDLAINVWDTQVLAVD